MVALGTTLYAKAVLVVGDMAGVGLPLQYTSDIEFWVGFSLINLPFYLLGWKRMGGAFVLRTFVAVKRPDASMMRDARSRARGAG